MVVFGRYIAESFQSLAVSQGIQLHFEAETEALWMDFDTEKMQSILNLLSNALKFTPEGGQVCLQIAQLVQNGQSHCRISVRDTGIGIPAEQLGRACSTNFIR